MRLFKHIFLRKRFSKAYSGKQLAYYAPDGFAARLQYPVLHKTLH